MNRQAEQDQFEITSVDDFFIDQWFNNLGDTLTDRLGVLHEGWDQLRDDLVQSVDLGSWVL
jgi:hypothetical protein